MIILIFIILVILLCILFFYIRRRINQWTTNYISKTKIYELNIDKKKYVVKIKDLYRESKTIKGATSSFHYKNSILFYNKEYNKYFSIESYLDRDTSFSLLKRKDDQISDIFSKNLAGKTISAWVNIDDLNSEILGTEKKPIRIFKLRYDSNEYLTNEYLASIRKYKTEYRSDQILQVLFIIGFMLTIIASIVLVGIINLILF